MFNSLLFVLWVLLLPWAAAEMPRVDLTPEMPSVDLTAESDAWERTLEGAVRSVVSLRVTGTRDFDTESASNSQGTGFVVDAERGILLTNRHMVHAGPVVAEAVFLNHEEVEVRALYRDPVHDFGFYAFDPKAVRHMEVRALPLDPLAARVGLDIRVIGNDAGEKISILDGTLARMDRNAPRYGGNTYNDFNTFYIQAASNTSGGSSGSPVIDVRGRVVGLNAGGKTRAASSFYLPLDRVVRALDFVRDGQPVPRGTLQTVLRYTPFDELVRLGLGTETEEAARSAPGSGTGLLVVEEVVPEGPADGALQPGDILVRVDGASVTHFVGLESHLDDHVGETITVEVERGGQPLSFELQVGDLHAISPDEYLEVGRAILHDLSYQQARNHMRPVRGVYVAISGYMLSNADVPSGAVITHVDGQEVPDLDAAQEALESKADGQRVRIRFSLVHQTRHAYETVAVMDRRWFPMRRCVRDDTSGGWPCAESPPPPPLTADPGATVLPPPSPKDRIARRVAPALVMVDFDIPYPTAGVKDLNYVGVGTVIDAERGLIVVDRDTVPVGLGDILITFAGAVRVPGQLLYLHPVHNFAVLRYDPALLGDTIVDAVEFSRDPPRVDMPVWLVGLDRDFELVSSHTKVTDILPLELGVSHTPRFRDANVEGVVVEDAPASLGGVLTDKRGRLVALWSSFLDQAADERTFHGLPYDFLAPIVEPLRRGEGPEYRWLGFEVTPLPLAVARDRGLSDERIREILLHDPEERQVFEVRRIHAGAGAGEHLRDADLLLAIDGQPVTRMHELEKSYRRERVKVTILRDEQELTFEIESLPLGGRGPDRVVSWAGLLIHEPHFEVEAQQGLPAHGVYIAWLWYGSPAARYGLRPTRRVIAVDEQPTPDLDAFLAAVAGRKDGEALRLLLEGLDGSLRVNTLKLDLEYWPTQILEWKDGVWTRRLASVEQAAER